MATPLEEAVASITLPGKTFIVDHEGKRTVNGKTVPWEMLVIKFRAPDADRENGRRKEYEWREHPPALEDKDEALRWVMAEIIKNEVHELCEFTLVDGERHFDPHQGLSPQVTCDWSSEW